MAIIDFRDLSAIRKKHQNESIVFCSGVFDLTHAGHVLFFEDCKRHGDILVVAVGDDIGVRRLKGCGRPVMPEHVRLRTVEAFKPVDYSFISRDIGGHVLSFMDAIFEALEPDVYVINSDTFDIERRRELTRKYQTRFEVLERSCPPEFDEISTTKVIKKIREFREE